MSLNLLKDPWVPVICGEETITVRPAQIADPDIGMPAWPRADFRLACLELLIGLMRMAAPPADDEEWLDRLEHAPDPSELQKKMEPFIPYFNLCGDGPRFLQDMEKLEDQCKSSKSEAKPVDILFIDSASDNSEVKNSDLMVKRERYTTLSMADAAMALYTLQAYAPTGGQGHRTSMRGGGPMTTIVQPISSRNDSSALWRLVCANVPPSEPLDTNHAGKALPWLRETASSETSRAITTEDSHPLEAFFGMPRRIRLVFENNRVTKVMQIAYGNDYKHWEHPLTPYYRPNAQPEEAPEWLPKHPKPGRLSYQNWLGVTLEATQASGTMKRKAAVLRDYQNRPNFPDACLLAGGWAMNQAKPEDFSLHTYPLFPCLNEAHEERIHRLVEASEKAQSILARELRSGCLLRGTMLDTVIENFWTETEYRFRCSIEKIIAAEAEVEKEWLYTLHETALNLFSSHALNGLEGLDIKQIEKRIESKRKLSGALYRSLRKIMELPQPDKKVEREKLM